MLPRIDEAHEGRPCVLVAHDGAGQVLGAAALQRRTAPGPRVGEVAWLHCREDPAAAAVLVQAVLERTADLGTVTAFGRPTPWPPHLPGVPLHNRSVTIEAFTAAGFRTRHQWLLLHRGHTGSDAPVGPTGAPARSVPWITPDGTLHTRRTVPPLPPPAHVRRHLLRRSLEVLDRAEAHEALATVDLLGPDASSCCDTLVRAGFEEVDLLRSLVLG
ncbi:hypothetical protein AB0I39_27490 [Kitasatospora purpeofusca]|uniref:hypothetical protein n=1 Tax=Kitasatospora purpeofusca TaxID=67352 RepID=UPI0033EEEA4C